MIDTIIDNTELETTMDNVDIYHSDNDSLIPNDNDLVMEVNKHSANADQGTSASSEDESLSTHVCVPITYGTDELNPSTNIVTTLGHMDETGSSNNVEKKNETVSSDSMLRRFQMVPFIKI